MKDCKERPTSITDLPLGEVDGESTVNQLGTDAYVDGLVAFLRNASKPLTVALQGEWGSGKTSLMHELKHRLCGDEATKKPGDYFPVVVNTWEYSMLSTPEMTVVKILEKLLNDLMPPTLKDKAKKVFSGLIGGAADVGMRIIGGMNVASDDVGAMAAKGIKAVIGGGDRRVELKDLRKLLKEGIEERSKEYRKGVMVFVDDLDRLNPTVAVQILELLKNVFTLPGCLFVLAIDYGVVVKGLKDKFGEMTPKNEREFCSFFDKIIQVPFSLPVVSYRTEKMVLDNLLTIGYITSLESETQAYDLLLVSACTVGKNPRAIKRLLNTISLLQCIDQAKAALDPDRTAEPQTDPAKRMAEKTVNLALVALQVCYPKVYQMLLLKPDFHRWNADTLKRAGIDANISPAADTDEAPEDWQDVLHLLCQEDDYMKAHEKDIRQVLNVVNGQLDILAEDADEEDEPEDKGAVLRRLFDRTCATNLDIRNSGAATARRRDILAYWPGEVVRLLNQHTPDLQAVTGKRSERPNRGEIVNSIYVKNPGQRHEIRMTESNGKMSAAIVLETYTPRPAWMEDMKPADTLQAEGYAELLREFDAEVERQRARLPFKGDGLARRFASEYPDGWKKKDSDGSTRSWTQYVGFELTFSDPNNFLTPEVAQVTASLIEAAAKFRNDFNALQQQKEQS